VNILYDTKLGLTQFSVMFV